MKYIKTLNDTQVLREGDIVCFKTYKGEELEYRVYPDHLANPKSNDEIFNYIWEAFPAIREEYEQSYDYKYKLCSIQYGYPTYSGCWPSFRAEDYAAATRIVKYLFKLLGQTETIQDVNKRLLKL